MHTTKINKNIRLEKGLVDNVDQVSRNMWLNFSTVVNLLLKKFVMEKKIEISAWEDVVMEKLNPKEKKEAAKLKNFDSFYQSL